MFEVRIKNGVMLKNLMTAIKELFTHVKWFCTNDGISLYGMDVSHCSVLRLRLERQAFDKYRCDRDIRFTIRTSSLSKILKYVTIDDMITIKSNHRRDKIDVTVEPFGEVDWSAYEIRLIDYNITELDINPEEEAKSATIFMPSTKFQRICHDLSQVGDRITISCTEEVVKFFTRGEMGTGLVRLYSTFYCDTEHLEVKFDVKEPMSATFRLKELNQFTKATPLTPQVIINLRGPRLPLEVIYNINTANLGTDYRPSFSTVAVLRLYLTPDVEIED